MKITWSFSPQSPSIVGVGTYVCTKSRETYIIIMHVNINKRDGGRLRKNRAIKKFQAEI